MKLNRFLHERAQWFGSMASSSMEISPTFFDRVRASVTLWMRRRQARWRHYRRQRRGTAADAVMLTAALGRLQKASLVGPLQGYCSLPPGRGRHARRDTLN